MSATSDRDLCRRIYGAAAALPTTGDETKWPDVLAYKFPIVHLPVLLRLMGLVDDDLVDTVVKTGRSGKEGSTEDTNAFANVLAAAIAVQARRVDERNGVGAAAVAAGS